MSSSAHVFVVAYDMSRLNELCFVLVTWRRHKNVSVLLAYVTSLTHWEMQFLTCDILVMTDRPKSDNILHILSYPCLAEEIDFHPSPSGQTLATNLVLLT